MQYSLTHMENTLHVQKPLSPNNLFTRQINALTLSAVIVTGSVI